ncbi:protein kinase [Pseudoxanthomonas koreensis]|uniref:protein kinase domain-containing protein n=1 Tax=Pseudoxanthomonas koreensis TaxID=266061 RepID=UPI0035A5A1A8
MNPSTEMQALQWLERALERPAPDRLAWLHAQSMPDGLRRRVVRLLESESSLGDFLEHPPAMPVPDGFPQPGERVGPFQLAARIDSGGMGVVHLAHRVDRAYEQQVAVKLIRPLHPGADPALLAQLVTRFENERLLLARLTHPNIARILDGGSTASGIPWLAMEYVEGGVSLIEYCERAALDVAARVRLFCKVCDGVQEAHRHLIVHRDLKPENILVGTDGEPRLLDFGIARMLDAGDAAAGPALTTLTAMTPAYASPEQVRRQPATTRSDVYSLGVVLYQLLAGVRPYALEGLSPAEAERTICHTQPRPLRQAVSAAPLAASERRRRSARLSSDLERIVAKAMHKDLDRRYGSAQELADDLHRHLQGRPVLAHPDSAWYRTTKFVGRHRAGTALGALAVVAVLAATAGAAWQARKAAGAAEDMRQVNAFLLDVLSTSDPYESGAELTLSQALDAAAARIDQHFPDRPDLSAELRFGIGYSMLSRFRLEQAAPQLERALHDSQRMFGAADVRTLRIVEGLAGLRHAQGRIGEAEALYRDGIARSERAGLQHDPVHLYLVSNLGMLYMTQDRYEEAATMLERALALWQSAHRRAGPDADHANLLSNLAQVAHAREQYAQSDALYRQAQAEFEQLHPQGGPDLAIVLGNRGMLAEDQGDVAGALALYRQSLAVRERVFSGDHPSVVVGLSNVARLLVATGEPAGAAATATRAAAMADRVYTSPHSRHPSTLATLAEALLAEGDAAAAGDALLRAHGLAAGLEAPPPSLTAYLQRIGDRLCHAPGAAVAACAQLHSAGAAAVPAQP